jgi:hypothetical protein
MERSDQSKTWSCTKFFGDYRLFGESEEKLPVPLDVGLLLEECLRLANREAQP